MAGSVRVGLGVVLEQKARKRAGKKNRDAVKKNEMLHIVYNSICLLMKMI